MRGAVLNRKSNSAYNTLVRSRSVAALEPCHPLRIFIVCFAGIRSLLPDVLNSPPQLRTYFLSSRKSLLNFVVILLRDPYELRKFWLYNILNCPPHSRCGPDTFQIFCHRPSWVFAGTKGLTFAKKTKNGRFAYFIGPSPAAFVRYRNELR